MVETIGPVVAFVIGLVLFIAAIRRRARMTPEQRAAQDQAREIRELRREVQRQRWN